MCGRSAGKFVRKTACWHAACRGADAGDFRTPWALAPQRANAWGVIRLDLLILGGGIAGLWTLVRARHTGLNAMLLESRAIGAGQSGWSQGIIHGGIKYALTGEASAASKAIAEMPGVWAACLAGKGEGLGAGVDLSSVTVLSDHQHVWTTPGLVSRIAGVAAKSAIRTPVKVLERSAWPEAFAGAPRGIDVYQVGEPVLPGRAVMVALAAGPLDDGTIGAIREVVAIRAVGKGGGEAERALVDVIGVTGESVSFEARVVACLAGEGNEALARLAGVPRAETLMQRRPLHMVMARARLEPGEEAPKGLPRIYGHCLGASTVPRLTITTIDEAGEGTRPARRVYYLGGAIAEEGVKRDERAQIDAASDELAACVPWIDADRLEWATGRIDRSEGLTAGGKRPDEPVLHRHGAVVLGWPTKLAFAPALAERVLESLAEREASRTTEAPRHRDAPRGEEGQEGKEIGELRPVPAVAEAPWVEARFTGPSR